MPRRRSPPAAASATREAGVAQRVLRLAWAILGPERTVSPADTPPALAAGGGRGEFGPGHADHNGDVDMTHLSPSLAAHFVHGGNLAEVNANGCEELVTHGERSHSDDAERRQPSAASRSMASFTGADISANHLLEHDPILLERVNE